MWSKDSMYTKFDWCYCVELQGAKLSPLEEHFICPDTTFEVFTFKLCPHKKLDSMFVHFPVPVASSSAFPSRPTSMFCDNYVIQYFHDLANYTIMQ